MTGNSISSPRRRGMALVQLLVGMMVSSVVLGGVFVGFLALWNMQSFSVQMPGVQEDARKLALTVAGSFRRATLCTSADSSCTVDAAVESVASSGATVYRRTTAGALSKVVYVNSGGNAIVAEGGTTTILATGGSIALTFYQGSTYHSSSLTTYTPSSSTTKNLAAVGITSTVTQNGLTGTYTTLVRLRNSPKKTFPGE